MLHTNSSCLATELEQAIERQEFQLHYQPVVSLQNSTAPGFEALLRWQHPQRGLIPPAKFIPVAEETGLIVPLSYWVLQEACQQMVLWQSQSPEALMISVNLSSKLFLEVDLAAQVQQTLQETGLDPASLKLEITESVLAENAVAEVLLQLKALDIQIHLDDFGTGYSSLSYLLSFAIDGLKADRSFVAQLDVNRRSLAILRMIVGLAQELNLEVTAEGIETKAQLCHLKQLGCNFGQGYLFSRPLPAHQVSEFIMANRNRPLPQARDKLRV